MSHETEKASIRQQIRILQESHIKHMDVLIKRLAALQAIDMPSHVFTIEQYQALQQPLFNRVGSVPYGAVEGIAQTPLCRQSDHQLLSDVAATKGKT